MINPLRLQIPAEISTDRLQLRCPQPGDGINIIDSVLQSLPELKKWMPWATDDYDANESQDWCRRAAANRLLGTDAPFLIYLRSTSKHIGNITAFVKDAQVPKYEIGYWLVTSEVGHGYMTEALQAVTRMTFEIFSARRIEIRTDALNLRSRRVAERGGYALEGILKNECRENDTLRDTCLYAQVR